jgi:predicted nucleotidyltransferase
MGIYAPVMGSTILASDLAAALFGKVRRNVLALLYGSPDRSFFLREITRAVGAGQGAVQRELERLVRAGIVQRRRNGRQVYYQADPDCPVFPELRSMVAKTLGLLEVLRQALEPVRDRIACAFIYGSVARGDPGSGSDVDLLVVGDVDFAEIAEILAPTQELIEREVNPSVFGFEDASQRVIEGGHFLTRVIAGPKLFLIGDERELEKLARQRLADRSHNES